MLLLVLTAAWQCCGCSLHMHGHNSMLAMQHAWGTLTQSIEERSHEGHICWYVGIPDGRCEGCRAGCIA
jgi:hypothetical protein